MTKTKRILLTILPLIGLALSIELCFVYYNANFAQNAHPSICAINEAMDCDGVAKTSFSQFFGVPLSLWGIILYLFFLFMTYVEKIPFFNKIFKNPTSYIFVIGIISFVLSMILGCISIFKINSICIFCFMTYLLDLIIALTAKNWGKGALYEIKNSFNDFIEAIKVPKNAILLAITVIIAASVLVYTSISNVLAPQLAKQKELKQYFNIYTGLADGNELGPKNADVVIHEYVDFNCSGCFLANLYTHRITDEFENVKFIQHNLPLQKACNPNMQFEGHENSCLKTSYALAAKKQNMYWQMADILFLEKVNTEKEIIEEARLLDFDIKKLKEDANSEEIKKEIKESVEEASRNNVDGTPSFISGMKLKTGVKTYPEFKQYIIEQGGIEKAVNEQ